MPIDEVKAEFARFEAIVDPDEKAADRPRMIRYVLQRYLPSATGRGKVLASMVISMRAALGYHHNYGDLQTLANWVAKVDVILERCSGEEPYDRVALNGVLGDIRALAGDRPPDASTKNLVAWIRARPR
jgi:hypothetical protein